MSGTQVKSTDAALPFNQQYFMDRIRRALFAGRMEAGQVDGVERIVHYRDTVWPAMPDEELAYVLATVKHETAHTMQPITEMGSHYYLRSKPYWPFIGRGLVQLTWKRNYDLFGVKRPDDALTWPVALDICFRGMILGLFTGRKLADYIHGNVADYESARRIINGTDRAKLVAGYATAFLDALRQARHAPAESA